MIRRSSKGQSPKAGAKCFKAGRVSTAAGSRKTVTGNGPLEAATQKSWASGDNSFVGVGGAKA